jgi:hypothetical protein
MNPIHRAHAIFIFLGFILAPVMVMATAPEAANDGNLLGKTNSSISTNADNTNVVAMLDELSAPAVTGQPTAPVASMGQQPFPIVNERDQTPSLINNYQLVQLFQLEATPDTLAAGEAYVTGNFDFVKFPGPDKQYRYQVIGEYGITNQISAGTFIPLISSKNGNGTHVGFGDVGIYGKYKFDRLIDPQVIDLTAQLDMILPTGDRTRLEDTGKFGVRPLLLAYKDFGMHGPGDLGMYALLGFTITTNSDFRFGLAATYQYNDFVGIMEFYDQAGDKQGRPLVQFTPGLAYRGLDPLEFSIGAPIGVNSGTPDWGINFKITYLFPK